MSTPAQRQLATPAPDLPHSVELAERLERTHDALLAVLGELADHLDGINRPASRREVVLTALVSRKSDTAAAVSASLGVYNQNNLTVYVGVGGEIAMPTGRAIAVPAYAGIVLPFAVQDVEVGALPADLVAGDAVVTLIRFATAQPFFFGAWR
jgi:hypothetical protein